MTHFMGIEIGGTKFQAVIGDSQARIIAHHKTSVNKESGAEGIRQEILKTIEFFKSYHPVSIGLGFGGPINHENGIICTSHQVKGWNNFPIGPWLKEISALPVNVDNDANTAGLAEAVIGQGKNNQRVFYVTIGSGMGGGMVINEKIYHGEIPGEGEIGLMPFDHTGAINMESQCCGWAADRKIQHYTQGNPLSRLATLTKGMNGGEAKYLVQAINEADPGALLILNELADNIAFALSYAVLLFHPKIIVIGGGLSLLGNPLFEKINKSLPTYLPLAFQPAPEVKIATLGEDVVCIGALILAQQAIKT